MKNVKLTDTEFRFLREALRGSVFDYYGCGCGRRSLLIEEVLHALEDAVDDDLPDVDLERLLSKLEGMSGCDSRELIEGINRCYFAETVEIAAVYENELSQHDPEAN